MSREDWPDVLPAVVLGANRRAPRINDDPLMANLRDAGRPAAAGITISLFAWGKVSL
ncbi:hypothetical protein ACWDKQ_33900 [Saccharopolyspora sp. NPDC000995]